MFRHPVRIDGSYVYSVYPPKGPEILSFLTVCRQAKPGPDICLGRSKDLTKARKGDININTNKNHTSETILAARKEQQERGVERIETELPAEVPSMTSMENDVLRTITILAGDDGRASTLPPELSNYQLIDRKLIL